MSDRRAWADLPLEIISSIRERLLWEDYFNFRFTCRNWNFAAEFDGTVYENAKYPFLLRFSKSNEKKNSSSSASSSSSGIYCRAYSPAYNKTYYLHAPAAVSGARISCSGYGWLLFSGQHRIFFYFPSTGQAINLPYYTRLGRGSFNQMSFSAPPTSPDCVVLGLNDTECTKGAEIVFLRRGQTDWQRVRAKNTIRPHNHRTKKLITSNTKKTIRVKSNAVCLQKFPGEVKGEFPRPRYNCSPLFHKGAFYCLDRDGRLGVINPKGKKKKKKDETWRVLDTSATRHFMDDPRNEAYLVECRGELIAVVVGPMGKMVRILRFYKPARVWQMVHSLGNQMIFLSHVGCVAVECRDGQAREWENTIHFPRFRDNRHVFYSISSGQFHSFDNDGEHTWDDLYETSHPLSHAWLTPVFCIPPGAQLDWSKKGRTKKKKHDHHTTSRRMMHPHYVIRSLSFLLPPSEHPYQQNNKQPEAPIARPCLVLSNEYDGEVTVVDLVVNLAQEEKMVVGMMAEAELAMRIGGRKVYSNPEHGLLVLMDEEAHTCSVLDLKSMVETQLPPLETSGNCRDVVVHVPPGDSKLAVIAFGEEDEGVEHRDVAMAWRDGDEMWTRHAKQGTDPHNGTVFHRGKMYGYRGWWAFVTIELRDGEYLVEERTEVEDPEFRSTPGFERFTTVLVGSCGELLLFVKYYASNCHITRVESVVLGISVFKMDFGDMKWRMLEDLGDRAFFWGGWGCYSCCASKSGFERNAIYFVEEYGRDVHMYDYVDQSIVVTLPRPDLDDSWIIDGFFMLYD